MRRILSTINLLMITMGSAGNSLAQICDENQQPSTPSHRFAISDGVVIDSKTGLMWKQCTEGMRYNEKKERCDDKPNVYTWQGFLEYTQQLNLGRIGDNRGYDDWRVPNIKELESIVEYSCISPAINLDIFSNTSTVPFWSSSTVFFSPFKAWTIQFNSGTVAVNHKTEFNARAYGRLVRDWR